VSTVALILLDGGPLDGAEIKWPTFNGELPMFVQFGFYSPCEPGHPFKVPRPIKHHRYEAYRSTYDGEPGESSTSEWREYVYAGESSETSPSVEELWSSDTD